MSSFQVQEDIRLIEMAKDPVCGNRSVIIKEICELCSRKGSEYLMARVLCELPFTDYEEFVFPICEMLQSIHLRKRDYSKVKRIFEHWTETIPGRGSTIKKTTDFLNIKYPDFRMETGWK